MSWRHATRTLFQGQGSYGNGAAMRVAPVANSPHHAAELAVRSAEITHAHMHGQHGAACQAVAVYLALNSDPARPWTRIVELARRQSGPEHAAHALGNDVSALGSAPLAVLAFLRHRHHRRHDRRDRRRPQRRRSTASGVDAPPRLNHISQTTRPAHPHYP